MKTHKNKSTTGVTKQMDIDELLIDEEKKITAEENLNMETGEITEGKLGEATIKITIRPDGSKRVQQDFTNCPTMTEQHTAHLTDINYLIKKHKPDELAAYIAARNQYRQEILGHDFSREPSLQEAKNVVYKSKQEFDKLPDEVRSQFKNHVEFLKFIDNPANAEKMLRLGILKKKQIENLQSLDKIATPETKTPTTTEEKDTKQK